MSCITKWAIISTLVCWHLNFDAESHLAFSLSFQSSHDYNLALNQIKSTGEFFFFPFYDQSTHSIIMCILIIKGTNIFWMRDRSSVKRYMEILSEKCTKILLDFSSKLRRNYLTIYNEQFKCYSPSLIILIELLNFKMDYHIFLL